MLRSDSQSPSCIIVGPYFRIIPIYNPRKQLVSFSRQISKHNEAMEYIGTFLVIPIVVTRRKILGNKIHLETDNN